MLTDCFSCFLFQQHESMKKLDSRVNTMHKYILKRVHSSNSIRPLNMNLLLRRKLHLSISYWMVTLTDPRFVLFLFLIFFIWDIIDACAHWSATSKWWSYGKIVPEKSHRFLLIFFLKIPNIHEEVTGFFEPKIKWTGYCVKVKDDLGQCDF